ncbi:MAG: TadE/TadG family type IV pilus assembly protein [Kiritimatiellia bacterium]
MSSRRGQAMVETVLAVFFVTLVFFGLFGLSRMVTARILVDHAAARAARAKAVGFNDFMCLKSARVALIPVAGERLWPVDNGEWNEAARVPIYLSAEDEGRARGILDYRWWDSTDVSVSSGYGLGATSRCDIRLATDDYTVEGQAEVESHFPLYMFNQGP